MTDNKENMAPRRPIITLKLSKAHTNLSVTRDKAESRDLAGVLFAPKLGGGINTTTLMLRYVTKEDGATPKETIRYASEELAREAYVILKRAAQRNVDMTATDNVFHLEKKSKPKRDADIAETRSIFKIATKHETPIIALPAAPQLEASPENEGEHPMAGLKRFLSLG